MVAEQVEIPLSFAFIELARPAERFQRAQRTGYPTHYGVTRTVIVIDKLALGAHNVRLVVAHGVVRRSGQAHRLILVGVFAATSG